MYIKVSECIGQGNFDVYFVTFEGVTAYVGRTNLKLISKGWGSAQSSFRTYRRCILGQPCPEVPPPSFVAQGVSGPNRGPPRLVVVG